MTTSIIVLGTAQLGMNYGVANRTGQPASAAALEMLTVAYRGGVRLFDTAQAYGSSEAILGAFIRGRGCGDEVRVVTKLAATVDVDNPAAVQSAIAQSCERLGVSNLWAVLLHREQQLDAWSRTLGGTMRELQQRGIIQHLGGSVYTPESSRRVLESPDFDMVEMPSNVFDRRPYRSGIIELAQQWKKTVLVRSVFLQGLVVMNADEVPVGIENGRIAVRTLERFCVERNLCVREFAYDYVAARCPGAMIVIGAETVDQIAENLAMAKRPRLELRLMDEWDQIWPQDLPALVDPTRWPVNFTL